MSEEDKLNLESLTKQYKNSLIRLKSNEDVIKLREKYLIFFFICGIYTWIAIIVATIQLFQNELIKILIVLVTLGSNIYIHLLFSSYYIKEIEQENEFLFQTIDELSEKIDLILKENNIDNNEFYKKILSDFNI